MKYKLEDTWIPALVVLIGLGLAGLLRIPPARAADEPPGREPIFKGLGTHGRKVSTASPEAQAYFNQGLCFLYAFNHDEAERSFRQAAALDPECAMAWWGIATANGPHINNPVVPAERGKAAWVALAKARKRMDKLNAADRALIEAASTRFSDPPPEDRKALDRAYATAMEGVWRDHFNDADVGALYAEALMDLRPWDLWTSGGEPQPGTEKVLETLEAVLAIQPDHPMACHLYIHAVEASPHPERAVRAADRLRTLQPGLPHLVHMPSHIDVRLGRWKEAAEANERAIVADQAYRGIRPTQGFYQLYMLHDRQMLAYAALMRGESGRAIREIDTMLAELPIAWSREHAVIVDACYAMPFEVRMRFGRWDEILASAEPEAVFPIARALRHAARGVAFAAKGQVKEARGAQAEFLAVRKQVAEGALIRRNAASDLLNVAERLMAGEILYREGKEEEAFNELEAAVRAEDALKYAEPPDWLQPVRHTLGAALLKSGRLERAEAVYREDLKRLPHNGWSLFGLMRAQEMQGKRLEAKEMRARWDEVWKDADVRLTSSCFCLPGE